MGYERDVVVKTLEDVEGVPEHLQSVAFSKVFDLRVSQRGDGDPPDAVQHRKQVRREPSEEGRRGDALETIAGERNIPQDAVKEVYTLRDGEVELAVPTGKLSQRIGTATKQIALLVAGARQAAGVEEWTSLDTIREACVHYKRIDESNFAKTVRAMEDDFQMRRESARKTSVKLRRAGWEHYDASLSELGGAS